MGHNLSGVPDTFVETPVYASVKDKGFNFYYHYNYRTSGRGSVCTVHLYLVQKLVSSLSLQDFMIDLKTDWKIHNRHKISFE